MKVDFDMGQLRYMALAVPTFFSLDLDKEVYLNYSKDYKQ